MQGIEITTAIHTESTRTTFSEEPAKMLLTHGAQGSHQFDASLRFFSKMRIFEIVASRRFRYTSMY